MGRSGVRWFYRHAPLFLRTAASATSVELGHPQIQGTPSEKAKILLEKVGWKRRFLLRGASRALTAQVQGRMVSRWAFHEPHLESQFPKEVAADKHEPTDRWQEPAEGALWDGGSARNVRVFARFCSPLDCLFQPLTSREASAREGDESLPQGTRH